MEVKEARVATSAQESVRCVCFMCISCVPRSLLRVNHLRPKVSASCASVAFQGLRFMCISCVPRSPLHVYQLRPKVSASCASVAFQGLRFMCISCVPSSPLHVYRLRPKVSASCVSVASQGLRFMCIGCVPRSPLHVYRLRPKVSASCVSVASQCLRFMCIRCVPRSQLHVYHPETRPNVFIHLPRPNRAGKNPQGSKGHFYTKYRNTIRRLASALNGYMEGNSQGRERYHPCLSPTTMATQQCSRRTSKRGTLVPEPFVLSSAAWYTTGNLP